MRKFVPLTVFFLASTVLLFTFPVLGLAAFVATAAYALKAVYDGVTGLISRISGKGKKAPGQAESRRARPQRRVRDALVRGKYYSRRGGWDLNKVPFDLKPTVNGKDMYLTRNGVPEPIIAERRRDGSADFSFRVYDAGAAQRVADRIGDRGIGASITRTDAGYVVKTTEAALADELLAEAYPLKSVAVRKETHSVNQYLVSGCATEEEAMRRFMAMKEEGTLGTPFKASVYDVFEVDGMSVEQGERPWMPKSLGAGEWVFADEKVETFGGSVMACGESRSELLESAEHLFDETTAERVPSECVASNVYGCNEQVESRTVCNSEGKEVSLVKADRMKDGIVAVCRCATLSELVDIINGGAVPEGRFLEVGDVKGLGTYDLCIPVDSQNVSRLALQGEASPSQARFNSSVGVSPEDLVASELADMKGTSRSVTMKSSDTIGFNEATVDGVPVKELMERMSDNRLAKLDEQTAARWLRDASMIQSVSMTVDIKNMQLLVTSQVRDTVKVESRKLTDEDVRSLERRGKVSKAEMKDVLMQMHPDIFESYSKKDKVADPLADFIGRREPKTVQQVRAERQASMSQQQKTSPVQQRAAGAKRQVKI